VKTHFSSLRRAFSVFEPSSGGVGLEWTWEALTLAFLVKRDKKRRTYNEKFKPSTITHLLS